MLKIFSNSTKRESTPCYAAPKGDWLLGHFTTYAQNPLHFLSRCAQEYGDIVPLRFLSESVLFLNHPECIEEAFSRQNRTFMRKGKIFQSSVKSLLGNGLFLSEGKFYQQQRTFAQPAFHKQAIAAYGRVMIDETNAVINTWQNGQVRDVYQDYITITRSIIAQTMFGVSLESEFVEAFTEALDATMNHFKILNEELIVMPDWLPTPSNLRYRKIMQRVDKCIYDLLQQYQNSEQSQGNFLDMFLQARTEGHSVTIQQLRDEIINIFLAGHETTAIALTWISSLLSQHPDVEAKLFEEVQTVLQGRIPTVSDLAQLSYTEAVVLETLRIYPPVWIMVRTALEDTEILGHPVPKGMDVIACQWTAHRNPRFFPKPDIFNPERWMDGLAKQLPIGAYFPFSLGGRVCLGKAFGMMELVLVLATIVQKFQLKLIPDHSVEPFLSLTLRPKYGMKMMLSHR